MNGAAIVAEILKREGTEFLSCYPRNSLIEACAALDIRPILCRQERVGVGMADGYSRIKRGKMNGVFAAQAGPGIENAFPGVAQAYTENVPMLIIPAGLPLARQYVQPVFRAADVYRPVTKWSALAHNVQELPDLMRRAYHAHALRQGRPGDGRDPERGVRGRVQGRARLHAGAGAAHGARSGRDQGSRAHAAGGEEPGAVGRAGRASTPRPSDSIASRWPSWFRRRSSPPIPARARSRKAIRSRSAPRRARAPKMFTEFMAKADLVLAVGSSLTKTPFGPGVPAGKTIIHSTNDAGDINKEYRADHAVVGDAALVLDALIAEVGKQKGAGGGNALASLKEEVATVKKAWLGGMGKHLDSDETPINQYRVIRDLMRTVDRDNVIITHDSGSPREQLLPFWETTAPGSYMGWGKSTQLGYGLGITMGAKLAAPDKLCVNVMGDAAIGMTGMDIETAARNRIAILTVVFNNGVMGAERDVLGISTKKYGAMTVGGNYTKVAEGLNVAATRVEKPADIVPRDQGGGRRHANPARRSCSSSWSRKATTSRGIHWRGCRAG